MFRSYLMSIHWTNTYVVHWCCVLVAFFTTPYSKWHHLYQMKQTKIKNVQVTKIYWKILEEIHSRNTCKSMLRSKGRVGAQYWSRGWLFVFNWFLDSWAFVTSLGFCANLMLSFVVVVFQLSSIIPHYWW
jgi:hypothetical protein